MGRPSSPTKRRCPGAPWYGRCARRCHALLSAGSIAVGSSACGLTADFSGLQDGAPEDGGTGEEVADDSAVSATCPTNVTSCSIQVTTDTFDMSYDGYITYLNIGTESETNPTLAFTVPSGVTLYPSGCVLTDQIVPSSITALACSQSGTTISYAFTGTLPANGQIAIYYTTSQKTETVATCITVTASSGCP